MSRCAHFKAKGSMGILNSHVEGFSPTTQCRLESGHDGKHHARFQPFPGFADEHVWWNDDPSQT